MIRYKYMGTGNTGTFAWMMQRISGLVLAVVVLVHFFSMLGGGALGLARFVVGAVMVFGLYHTMNGFTMITDDYVKSPLWRGVLQLVYWTGGIILALLALQVI